MPGYVDLRSGDERAMEERARKPLDAGDEAIAHKLAEMIKRSDAEYSSNKAAYERTVQEARTIGNGLCTAGGEDHMKLVAYRVRALGASSRVLEMFWDGICGWMA